MDCTGGSHNGRGASAHTVIPFSIAIKRMSEILLYKASLCMRNLNNAQELVTEELQRLDISAETTAASVTKTFQVVLFVILVTNRSINNIYMYHS
jgi:tripartite motif-containing protein 2/3